MSVYVLVTERPLAGDSRVCREELRLRDERDADVISRAITRGDLRTRPGVAAWVEELEPRP